MLHQGVEFGLLVIVVLLSDHSNSYSSGYVSDSVRPDESVQSGINSDVLRKQFRWVYCWAMEYINGKRFTSEHSRQAKTLCYLSTHFFGSEFLDFSNGSWGSLLELDLVDALSQMDGAVSSSFLQFFSWHLY